MSLLLDALKRAEQEKLARGDRPDLQVVHAADAPAPASAASNPLPTGREGRAANLELEPIASPGAGGGSRPVGGQHAAQAVFQAKAPAREPTPRRGVLYAAVGLIGFAILAAGGYVWYVLQSLNPPGAQVARSSPPPASGAIAPAASPPAMPAPSTAATIAPSLTVPAPAAPPAEPVSPREQLMQQLLRENPAAREPAFRLDRSEPGPRVPAHVAAGYEALTRGDLAAARRAYQAALSADPAAVDAALGLATAEARAGNAAAAVSHYRRVLDLDPRNATAMAGLAALADSSRPGAVEAQLRQDVMAHPSSAALRFALGNLLAAQSRWSEAQAEYFEAHRLEPATADIAHNLAVSLDNLGERRLAADFYRRALEGARAGPSQFDAAAVERRLAELGP